MLHWCSFFRCENTAHQQTSLIWRFVLWLSGMSPPLHLQLNSLWWKQCFDFSEVGLFTHAVTSLMLPKFRQELVSEKTSVQLVQMLDIFHCFSLKMAVTWSDSSDRKCFSNSLMELQICILLFWSFFILSSHHNWTNNSTKQKHLSNRGIEHIKHIAMSLKTEGRRKKTKQYN